jgi:hypothetical protein
MCHHHNNQMLSDYERNYSQTKRLQLEEQLEEMAAVLRALNHLCYYVGFFALFVTYFVHNVSATVSYGKKRASGHQDRDHSPRIRQRASGYQDSDH